LPVRSRMAVGCGNANLGSLYLSPVPPGKALYGSLSTGAHVRQIRGRASEDIRLLRPCERNPRLLFQTRYRVNCFADLCPDYPVCGKVGSTGTLASAPA